jgi:hypothetical protein
MKKYNIGGITYVQRPLVFGQLRQLLDILKGVAIPTNTGTLGLINALDSHLPAALAVVLTPEGFPLRDKDLAALSAEIEFAITPEQAIEVVEDFFACNPIPFLLESIGNMVNRITAQINLRSSRRSMPEPGANGSTNLSSSCAPETSPGAMPSSGGTD